MSDIKTNDLHPSESHPRLLDIDSSLEMINHVERLEPLAANFNQEKVTSSQQGKINSEVIFNTFKSSFLISEIKL